ncbi:MAG: insulinase family protein [Candidatus Omnitrophica bacterium]|nr:insulinase family protein [Candidatus Omnitrophota bacterium]
MLKAPQRYQLSQLSNAVQILTIPMADRESSAVAIWVKVGGRYEPKKISGVSHFLEHMLFKGTGKRSSKQIKKEVEGVGGMLNAFTAEEATCYFSKLPAEHFARALDVLSDMVRDAALSKKELERERPVILEEIKMYKDQPAQYVHELMGELLWPEQPLGRSVAGCFESVSSIRRQDMVGFKKKYYQPKNILVSVSGPLSHQEVVRETEKNFPAKNGGIPSRFQGVQSQQTKPRFHFVEKETEQTHLVIGFHGVSRKDPRRFALGLLNIILGANMSSRLFEEVREKRGLAYEIKSGVGHYQDTGSVAISAGVENRKAGLAIRVILQELQKIARRSVSKEELRRAKDYFTGQFLMGLEDTLDHLLWAGEKVLYLEEIPAREKITQEIEKVNTQDIQKIAQHIFKTARANLALVGPLKEKEQEKIKRSFIIQ